MSDEEFQEEEEETEQEEPEVTVPGIPQLTFEESRVLGSLLEKEATTPDNYPLSLNQLHAACNQSSNRHPVLDLGTDVVEEAVEGLRYKNLALLVRQAGARVPKSRHTIDAEFPYMTKSQIAILCVLMLRGQQTAGELRQRTERMHPFSDIEKVEAQLEELINNKPAPLVKRIPAGGGRRVVTFVHLLCGDVEISDLETIPAVTSPRSSGANPGRIEELENEVASLRETVVGLRSEIDDIKQQLGI